MTKLKQHLEASSESLQRTQLDVDMLLRVKSGIVADLPLCVAELQEPFDFSDSCLVSRVAVDGYRQDIIACGRQKLKVVEAIKVSWRLQMGSSGVSEIKRSAAYKYHV